MTNKKISTVVASQIPSHIREDYPIFVQFLKNYYEFMEQDSGAVGALSKLLYNTDIDDMDPEFLLKLKQELALPLSIAMKDSKVFASNLKSLYAAKGTEEAFRILFRMLFNEEIIISYPREQILRASDGRWVQESFITMDTVSGSLPLDNVDFKLVLTHEDNSTDTFPTRIERTSATTYRAYFNFTYRVDIYSGDRVEAIDNNGNIIFAGTVRNSPAKVKIIAEGKYWQVGKVVTIEADGKNSVARVTRVGDNGELKTLEVLEYGYQHLPGTIYYVSPFRKPPQSSVVTIDSVITSVSPLTYSHNIEILDIIDSITESIRGFGSDEGTSDSYFLETYVSEEYTGKIVIEYDDVIVTFPQSVQEVSYSTWLESRTSLEFEFQPKTSLVGYWEGDRGKLSNPFIRLQDNYFYQVFSYLIDTSSDMKQMGAIEELIGPAGLKPFFNSNKQTIADFTGDISITRTISNERLFLYDVVNVEEQIANNPTLYKEDSIESFSDSLYKINSLAKTDEFGLDESSNRNVGLYKYEGVDFEDSTAKSSEVVLVDGVGFDDNQLERQVVSVLSDAVVISENPAKSTSFSLDDGFEVYDIVGEYGVDYFAENYTNSNDTHIQISVE